MQQTIILPYMRTSATRIPRRDLVMTGADSLTLRATIVEADHPAAQALVLTGGLGGPAARLVIHTDRAYPGFGWDYGRPCMGPGAVLWAGDGVISSAIGSFDFFVPFGAIGALPLRCGWAMLLSWDGGWKAETLAEGILHVRPMVGPALMEPLIMLTDPNPAALTDGSEAIYLAGGPGVTSAGSSSCVLPIATPTTLGGIKTDGTNTVTNASGVLTVIATLG